MLSLQFHYIRSLSQDLMCKAQERNWIFGVQGLGALINRTEVKRYNDRKCII